MKVNINFKDRTFTTISQNGKDYPSSCFELKELFNIIVSQVHPDHILTAMESYLRELILLKRHEITNLKQNDKQTKTQ